MDNNIFALRKFSVAVDEKKEMLKFDLYGNDSIDINDNESSLKSSFIIPVKIYPKLIQAFINAGLQMRNNGVNIKFIDNGSEEDSDNE